MGAQETGKPAAGKDVPDPEGTKELDAVQIVGETKLPGDASLDEAPALPATQRVPISAIRALMKADDARPLQVAPDVPWHSLDFREAMLLARVNGKRGRSQVIESCTGIDKKEASKLFDSLQKQGLIVDVD